MFGKELSDASVTHVGKGISIWEVFQPDQHAIAATLCNIMIIGLVAVRQINNNSIVPQ